VERTSLQSQWIHLRNVVDEIEIEIAESRFPAPSKLMCDILIAGEDHRLAFHPGVDPIALCRAFWKTYFCGTTEGASTIAMQLVRTVSGNLPNYPFTKKISQGMWVLVEKLKITPNAPKPASASIRCYSSWDSFVRQLSISLM
jgi:hypothetical protein